jgi:hypothetical protein
MNMKKKSPLLYILGAVVLYLVSTGVSFGIFKGTGSSASAKPSSVPIPTANTTKAKVDISAPRTEKCPLNGALFTKAEHDIWVTHRPLAVMIENHEEARPQSGLSYADIIYETVAEGGVTRFMGVFYCGMAAYNIPFAPVRSARTYFLDWVSEYDALYNHVGGAGNCNDDTVDPRAKALCQIQKYGIKDMDQFGIPFPTCYRNYDRLDHTVATEHTMVCESDKLLKVAEKRGWTNVDEAGVSWDKNFVPWKFADETKTADHGTTNKISFDFWQNYDAYGVTWDYDAATNTYKRSNGGKPHIDLETKQQLAAKNVVIQFDKETVGVDEHAHLLYATIGSGKALVFMDGKAIVGTWKKPTRTARTIYYDDKGKEVQFNPGLIWIENMDVSVKVSY